MGVNTTGQLRTALQRSRAEMLTNIASCALASANAIEGILNDYPGSEQITIAATSALWTRDSEETTAYKYHYDISDDNVTEDDIAVVTIARNSYSAAGNCGLCPQNETLDGTIRLRAKSIPSSSITAEYFVLKGKQEQEEEEDQEGESE